MRAHRRVGLLAVLAMVAFVSAQAEGQSNPTTSAASDSLESIYVVRSWRESRITPTDYCNEARTRFPGATVEDRYTFRSVETRADGRLHASNIQVVGQLHSCFAWHADTGRIAFFAEGALGEVTFTGRGECQTARNDYPEQGLITQRCFLLLANLSHGFLGGHLTTNTINSRRILGGTTDPEGYRSEEVV